VPIKLLNYLLRLLVPPFVSCGEIKSAKRNSSYPVAFYVTARLNKRINTGADSTVQQDGGWSYGMVPVWADFTLTCFR